MKPRLCVSLSLAFFLCFLSASARAATDAPAPHRETTQELLAKLNPQQKQQFDTAGKAYNEQRFADSRSIHEQLLKDFPGDPILIKFAAEAAIHGGAYADAVKMLQPLVQADNNDWQAVALLTRACAESGDVPCRDAGISQMLALHRQGLTPPQMGNYVVENVKIGNNTMEIKTTLQFWGPYQVYAMAKLSDASGKLFYTLSIESDDMDQPLFAKNNPDEAAKGIRLFSLDGYQETGLNQQGQRTQTHFTFKFFHGQPSYAAMRQEFIDAATGKTHPISSHTGLVVK
jgi:hypothetical protein